MNRSGIAIRRMVLISRCFQFTLRQLALVPRLPLGDASALSFWRRHNEVAGHVSHTEPPRSVRNIAHGGHVVDARIAVGVRSRGEFLEIPSLQLTRMQVQRLWGLDDATCHAVIIALTGAGFLEQTPAGAYIRANGRADAARRPGRRVENPASRPFDGGTH